MDNTLDDGRTRRSAREIAAGLSNRPSRGSGREHATEEARTHVEEILDRFRHGKDARSIARLLGLPVNAIQEVISETATDVDRADRRAMSGHAGRPPQYSDEDLLNAIRMVADQLGRTPSATEYARTAPRLKLPSLPTIHKRLGGWSAAVGAAGMSPNPANRSYSRRWNAAACLQALEQLVDELGRVPTFAHYEALARQRDDLPSAATVRDRLGSWSQTTAELTRRGH